MSKGILVVVSGFSGSGKGTVMKRLMEKYSVLPHFAYSVYGCPKTEYVDKVA